MIDEKLNADASYCLGWDIAGNLRSNGIDHLDLEAFSAGLKAQLNGEKSAFTDAEIQSVLNAFFGQIQQQNATKNLSDGKAFLEENASRPEVTVLPSGLQYEVLAEGSGKQPSITDHVTTHYHGTLIDGTVFDSSVHRGEPASFPVNGVIQGWVEALQLMKEGSKWRLYVPSDLAYGSQAAGSITPHSTLIFDVELLQVN